MNKIGVIIIIEDDPDDQFLLEDAFCELNVPNERLYFKDGDAVLEYLEYSRCPTFLIFSDMRMPRLNGMELMPTPNLPKVFFEKPADFQQLKELLRLIIKYWASSAAVEISLEMDTIKF